MVPDHGEGFQKVCIGKDSWDAIRISGMLPPIKYVAAHPTAPISATTHYVAVARIEPYGEAGKYRLIFAEPAKVPGHHVGQAG